MIIGDGIAVSQIWPVVSTADDEKLNGKIYTKGNMCNIFLVWFSYFTQPSLLGYQ